MKNQMSKISDLSRVSLQDVKNLFNVTRLVTLIDFIKNMDENGDSYIEIPTFGKILISKDLDFEFLPSTDLKKEVYGILQNPNNFLKNELKKVFNIGENA